LLGRCHAQGHQNDGVACNGGIGGNDGDRSVWGGPEAKINIGWLAKGVIGQEVSGFKQDIMSGADDFVSGSKDAANGVNGIPDRIMERGL
jgi:hypothetical protein